MGIISRLIGLFKSPAPNAPVPVPPKVTPAPARKRGRPAGTVKKKPKKAAK